MPFGINIRVDHGDVAAYWELVERVSALEEKPSIRSLGYPPHITLGKYDEVNRSEIESVVDALSILPALTLEFSSIGSFDLGVLILWARPTPVGALHDLHHIVHSMIDPMKCNPAYRPGAWTPHCSVALKIDDEKRGMAHLLLKEPVVPFTLTFDTVDCVASPPIAVIAERSLRQQAGLPA